VRRTFGESAYAFITSSYHWNKEEKEPVPKYYGDKSVVPFLYYYVLGTTHIVEQ